MVGLRVREDGLLRHLLALEGPTDAPLSGQQLSLFDPPRSAG